MKKNQIAISIALAILIGTQTKSAFAQLTTAAGGAAAVGANSPTSNTNVGINENTPFASFNINTTGVDGTNGERIAHFTISDADSNFFQFSNGSSVDNDFVPLFWGNRGTASQGTSLYILGNILNGADVVGNTVPVMIFDSRRGYNSNPVSGGSAITNRCLFEWRSGPGAASLMRMYGSGNLGLGNFTSNPTAQFHTLGTVRFQGLSTGAATRTVVSDNNGNLFYQAGLPLTGAACATNIIPKVTGTNTLGCSIIWDNGTSVGISTTSPRTFSSIGVYALVSGAPANGTVAKLDVNGLTFTNSLVVSSDQRLKKNIAPVKDALSKVVQLNGVTYDWKSNEFRDRNLDNAPQIGFLAQDVAKVIPEAVMIDDNGYYALNYNMITPVLAEAIKMQQSQIEQRDNEIAALKDRMGEMEKALSSCCMNYEQTKNQQGSSQIETKASLEQNVPNPFNEKTVIRYFTPGTASSTLLKIYSLDGKLIQSINLTKGAGSYEISANTFSPGTYVYHLIIDGLQVDSKIMTITK